MDFFFKVPSAIDGAISYTIPFVPNVTMSIILKLAKDLSGREFTVHGQMHAPVRLDPLTSSVLGKHRAS